MFILSIISSFFINKKKKYTEDSKYFRFLLYACAKIVIFVARFRCRVTGLEKIPTDSRFLLVENHRGNFDPILTWDIINKLKNPKANLTFISKPENFKYPAFGKIIHRCCFMPIDRSNARSSVRTLMEAADYIKKDQFSVCVYPEGTRNKTDEPLLDFHDGLFKIAQMANVPIVIATFKNTGTFMKNFPLKRTVVDFDVLDVIAAEKVKEMKTHEIGDYVKEVMLSNLVSN